MFYSVRHLVSECKSSCTEDHGSGSSEALSAKEYFWVSSAFAGQHRARWYIGISGDSVSLDSLTGRVASHASPLSGGNGLIPCSFDWRCIVLNPSSVSNTLNVRVII